MTRFRLATTALALAALSAAPAVAASASYHGSARNAHHGHGNGHSHGHPRPAKAFPTSIALPAGWRPEGIASGPRHQLYVGSIPTGAIYRADARTGEGAVLVPPREGRAAIGIEISRGVIWVAGGPTGKAFLYDAKTGADVATAELTTGDSFINDVAVVGRSAWFTDSRQPELRRVTLGTGGATTVTRLPITGAFQYDADPSTNEANGIVAIDRGRALLVVQSRTGKLFRVDAATGVSTEVVLAGGDLANGDGLLLAGPRELLVVRNRDNLIAQVRLDRRATSGTIVRTIADPDFRVPTTIAFQLGGLYAVNARFGTTPTPTTDYDIVRVDGR